MRARFRRPSPAGAVLVAVLAAVTAPARAEEGMWTFDHPPRAAVEKAYAVELTDAWLEHLRLASVRLTGCSASFASPDGLVLTNHHCVRACIEHLSTPESNLQATGFLAAGRADERRCPAAQAMVLVATEEVTDRVLAAARGLAADAANQARKAAMSRLEATCMAAPPAAGAREGEWICEAKDLYQGGQYWLYKYRRHQDVRLVFAPEGDIAHFGGDPDNFDFPRYCLDMALLRVYGADGAPLRPAHWLTWSRDGVPGGAPVFLSGHPGSTQRLLTAAQLRARRDLDYPLRIELGAEERGRLIEFSARGVEEARIARAPLLGIENNLKRRRGQLRALLDEDQMAHKAAAERALRQRVLSDPALGLKIGDPWLELDEAAFVYRRLHLRHALVEERLGFGGSLFLHAHTLVRGVAERRKPNEERLREYAESALPGVEQRLLARTPIYPQLETLRLGFSLEKLREHLGFDDPFVRRLLGQEAPQEVAARLVAGTRLADADRRRELWRADPEAFAAAVAADPLLEFAARVDTEARAVRRRWDDAVEAVEKSAGEAAAGARFAVYGTSVYPDATSTLRLTYGAVRGWEETPGGEQVLPFTYISGVFDRSTGRDPFALPARWLAARETLHPAAPFNFVATTDIIGGNSGSPLVDARGHLVGLAFDGNLHSLAGAFWFDGELNRTVAVDVRAMREALVKVYGARHLLDEIDGPGAGAASP